MTEQTGQGQGDQSGSLIGRASLAIQKELDIMMNILEDNSTKITEGE